MSEPSAALLAQQQWAKVALDHIRGDASVGQDTFLLKWLVLLYMEML